MAKYRLTKEAVEDLSDIWNYTVDNWSENQADKYFRILLDTIQSIADQPNLGKKYSEIKTELFGLKIKRHIIFYRISTDKPLEITRILHEQMDLKNRLKK